METPRLRIGTVKHIGAWLLPLLLCAPLSAMGADAASTNVSTPQCNDSPPAVTNATPGLNSQYQPGCQRRYHVTYKSNAEYDFSVLLQDSPQSAAPIQSPLNLGSQSVQLNFAADLEITVLGRTANHYQLVYRFANPALTLKAGGQPDESTAARMQAELLAPVFIEASPTGRIDGIAIHPGSLAVTHGLVRAVVSLMQFTAPENGDLAHEWTATEDDPNGTFSVKYTPLPLTKKPHPEFHRYGKQRISHTAVGDETMGNTIMLRKTVRPTGTTEVTYDASRGLLYGLNGTDKQIIEINHRKVGSSRNILSMRYLASRCLDTQEQARLLASQQQESAWNVKRAPLYAEATTAAEREALIAHTTLGDATAESLQAMLARLSAGAGNDINQTELYLKVKSLVILQPDFSAALTEQILKLKPTDPAYTLAITAFQTVGNEQSQTALLRLLDAAKGDSSLTNNLLRSLASANHPTAPTVDRFLALANAGDNSEIADTAKMALGVIARNLASTDQARSDALMNSFITQLRSSTDARSQWKLLLILGNAGTPATYDAVNDYLASPDSKLRSTAINALRWQKDPRVPGQLLRALNEDEDERVRIAAAKTMAFRPKTAGEYAAFKSALSNDKSANMRTVVLDILWQNRAIYPEAAKLVRHAAEHDIDQSVRERAKKLLKTTSTRK